MPFLLFLPTLLQPTLSFISLCPASRDPRGLERSDRKPGPLPLPSPTWNRGEVREDSHSFVTFFTFSPGWPSPSPSSSFPSICMAARPACDTGPLASMSLQSRVQFSEGCTVTFLFSVPPPLPTAHLEHSKHFRLCWTHTGSLQGPQEAQLPTFAVSSSLMKSFIILSQRPEGHLTRCWVTKALQEALQEACSPVTAAFLTAAFLTAQTRFHHQDVVLSILLTGLLASPTS